MKKIFILEDSPERNKIFLEILSAKNQITIATDIWEAKENFTKNSDYDILFLDHDLGRRKYVNSEDENTGYQFIKWLAETFGTSNYKIIVHSLNPSGASQMIKYTHDGEYIPFFNLVGILKEIK